MSKLREILKPEEELRLHVYDDATGKPIVPGYHVMGHPTIGWGRALDTNGITREEAELLLSEDIARANAAICKYPWIWSLTRARQDVCAAMAFQLGAGGFAKFPRLHAALEAGDIATACEEMQNSLWAKQTPKRAARMIEIMRRGEY